MVGKSLKWTEEEARKAIGLVSRLHAWSSAREAKFNRNLNRYYNSGRNIGDASATIWNPAYQTVGFNRVFYQDSGVQARLNIIKSAVDTVVSKLSQARVRPFFDAVRGDYETVKAARAAQEFFDQFYDAQKVYERAPQVARGALLFDGGHFWVDEDNLTIHPLPHWELFVNPYEVNAVGMRNVSMGMVFKRNYPMSILQEQFGASKVLDKYKDVGRDTVAEYAILYDLAKGRKWYAVNSDIVWCKAIDYKRIPVTSMWWSAPVLGWSTTCLADDLYTIQVSIDEIQLRIDQAIKQSPFNTIFIPEGSNIKETMLSNEAALVVPYMEGPGGGMPVVATPAPISPEYSRMLDAYIQKAYEIAGISQLSAQSKKPSGVTSGVALQTLEDVESERHNVTVQEYIHQFVELAELAIEVFPSDADILPEAMGRAKIKWSDIKKQRDMLHIQFSAGSALAKDPATKIQQIQQLQGLGIDLGPIMPQLLEIPDLETAYSVTTASYDYVQSVIQRAAETGEVDFLGIVNLEMLFGETVRWMLRLSANGKNKTYLENLNKLLEEVLSAQQEAQEPPPAPVPPNNIVPPPVPPVGAVPPMATA
jgi:hypothetical protein